MHGLVEGPAPADGDAAIAAFRPQSVAVYREEVHGSPRNAFPVTVTDVEPRADLVRVHAGDLAADVTVQAAADLELAPGQPGDVHREGHRGVGLRHLTRELPDRPASG